jgi:hypothetical protein
LTQKAIKLTQRFNDNAPLKKYLMCVTDGGTTESKYNTGIFEADQMTGPWKLVSWMQDFRAQAYFVNIPSKFISDDGRTPWLCYSANFCNHMWGRQANRADPPGSGYAMCLQELRLLKPGEVPPQETPLTSRATLARVAWVADDGKTGTEVTFAPKTVSWVAFFVTKVKPSTRNIGFSEITVAK